jgi:hypothetical protein
MRSKDNIRRFYICFLLLMFFACSILPASPLPEHTLAPSKTITLIAQSKTTPSPQVIPVITEINQTATPFISQISKKCILISNSSSAYGNLSGKVVIISQKEGEGSFILDLSTNQREYLGQTGISVIVSSNGDKIAYYHMTQHNWVLSDIKNKKSEILSDKEDHYSPFEWLSTDTLLMDYRRINYQKDPFMLPSLRILNTVNEKQQELLPENYPELNNWPPIDYVNWVSFSRIIVNSQLTHLLYPINKYNSIVLWDMKAQKEIKRIYYGDTSSSPVWSPDGTQFVTSTVSRTVINGNINLINFDDNLPQIEGGNDLYSVNTDGKVKRLTYFSTTFDATQVQYQWSPDGNMIAFWLNIPNQQGNGALNELSILDVKSGKVIDYCIDGFSLFWSPDSRQILLHQKEKSNSPNNIIVLDIDKEKAVRVFDNGQSGGWLSN